MDLDNNITNEFQEVYLTYSQVCIILSISTPTIKSFIKRGILKAYRLVGTNRKYIKRSELELAFQIIPIPKQQQSYEQVEKSLRTALQRGSSLQKLEQEYIETTGNPTVSGFCKWIYLNKRVNLINAFNGAITLTLK